MSDTQDVDTATTQQTQDDKDTDSKPKNQDNKDTDSKPKNQDKLYSQEQVDSIVEGRVAKYKDYKTLKEQAGKVSEYEENNLKLTNENKKYDETLDSILDSWMSEIPEEKKSLLPDDMDKLSKIRYINKNKTLLTAINQQTPQIIPKDDDNKQSTGLILGKYKDEATAAREAPKEFIEWRKTHKPT